MNNDNFIFKRKWFWIICFLSFIIGAVSVSTLVAVWFTPQMWLDHLDKSGSFLGGLGTLIAVFFALITYNDWKKIKVHEMAIERADELLKALEVITIKLHKVESKQNKNIWKMKVNRPFILNELAGVYFDGCYDRMVSEWDSAIYQLECVKDISLLKNDHEKFMHSLSALSSAMIDYLFESEKKEYNKKNSNENFNDETMDNFEALFQRKGDAEFCELHGKYANQPDYYDSIENNLVEVINSYNSFRNSIKLSIKV